MVKKLIYGGAIVRAEGRNQKVGLILTLLVAGVLFYMLNYFTPLFADDYSYSFSFYDHKRITGLEDIVKSQYSHYFVMNGRVVVHFFAQLFLWLGKGWFNIINTVAFLGLGILIFYHGVHKELKKHISLLIFIYGSLFIFMPVFGESFLWLTASSNYLHGVVLVLLYLIPYRRVAGKKKEDLKAGDCIPVMLLKLAGMFFFGLAAGWTNETLSAGLAAAVLAFIVSFRLRQIPVAPWMISGWVGNFWGGVFQLLSPGNSKRVEAAGGVNVKDVLENIAKITWEIENKFGILLIICAMIGFWYVYPKRKKKFTKKIFYSTVKKFSVPLIYLLFFFATAYSAIVVKIIPDRVWSCPLVILLIVTLSLYLEVSSQCRTKIVRHAQIFFVILFSLHCLFGYKKAYSCNKSVYHQFNQRMELIEEALEKGEDEVSVPAIRGNAQYCCYGPYGDLNKEPDIWPNTSLASYYGIARIIRSE